MDLAKICDPNFLKELSNEQLEQLSQTIRQFLIEKLSKTGGHIGPNLGVVELTIALHKVFESPKDKFLWDVGHQSYVHKILTGRSSAFESLRQYKGLSGFPKRNESDHDVWETGHSSTSLSAAMGMAIARDLKGTSEFIIPIIGDGALTGGMALEALNHIGHEKKNIIVILNDNEMSIAPNVGALHHIFARLRHAKTKAHTDYPYKDQSEYHTGNFFEQLGFTYIGPVDGHHFKELIEQLTIAKNISGPVLIHVLTKKGRGYKPAEADKRGMWHGTGPYKIDTGDFLKPENVAISWSEIISNTVSQIAREDSRVIAITPAMMVGSKLEKFAKEFPDRIYDVGIAEQHAATLAAGLAASGMKPFLAIYSTFLQRAYDQLVHDICRQNLNVFIGIDRAGLVGADGETHQGVFDLSFLRHIPNLVIMMPKDENEAQHLVYTGFQYQKGPIAIRYSRGNSLGVPLDQKLKQIPIGSWEVLKEGTDICILTFGNMIQLAIAAQEFLQREHISVKVVNARFIKPLDMSMLIEIFQSNLPILTIEEAVLLGGFGSSILEFAHESGYHNQYIECMGIPDRFIEHGRVQELWQELGLTVDNIIDKVRKITMKKGLEK